MLNGLGLFEGIGGLTIALQEWVRPVAYCEIDRYCQAVHLSNQQQGTLPVAPIWDDVRTLRYDYLPPVDIIYGGFPCQDISIAGNGEGLEGKRSGLFFEIMRLASEIRPKFIFLENVPAISVRGLDRVLLELTALGYDSRWTTISANSVGAKHIRERWFLLSHANTSRYEPEKEFHKSGTYRPSNQKWGKTWNKSGFLPRWDTEPKVDRVADGVPYQSYRIKGLGNAVVPKQAKEAFRKLSGMYGMRC
jgi:DNA (cytosine-5)-methyltransferase 1